MKLLSVLAFALALLYAPVVFAATAGLAIDMPGYKVAALSALPGGDRLTNIGRPIISANKHLTLQSTARVGRPSQKLKQPTCREAGNSLPGVPGTHKEAAVLTGKAEFQGWQRADRKLRKTYKSIIDLTAALV